MTHLAARPLTALSALCAEYGNHELTARVPAPGATGFASCEPPQNFLENAVAASHYRVMGGGDAVRSAGSRPPAVDRKSRNTLDIRIASSISKIPWDKHADHDSTKARTGKSHTDGRDFIVGIDLVEHTMIGNPPTANDQHLRFSENIHAKYRKSAALVPILHYCALERRASHSDPTHDGGWGGLRDRGVTPNERSGR